VLVAHDGAEWLPEALAALAAGRVLPAQVICVDTGSTDDSAELMEQAHGSVLRLSRETGYGQAVAAALLTAKPTTWVWLLHDDVAVEPTTLQALLAYAETSSSAALIGPKVRDWHDPRFLVEVGVTTDAAGHRETGLERREYDQGQRDGVRDALAVGTAAALIRRDVWDAVGGLDPHLPVFRDDLDLGWKVNAAGHRVVVVPEACVRHVRASTTGHRDTSAAPGRATGTDRRNALYVLLAHASWVRLLGLLPRLVVATVLRALGLLLTRQVGAAGDECRALLGVVGRPVQLHRARRARAATRTVSQRALRPLFASRALRIRARLGAFADWLSGGAPVASSLGALGDPGPEGPDGMDELAGGGPGVLRGLLLRPGVLLFLGLSTLALVAERSLLAIHGGTLYGGALLPAPAGASDLWSSYAASWHDVSVGTRAATPPSTALLALLSTVLLGKPWLVVDTLLLASVPLAGLSAYLVAARLVGHRYLRLWVSLTWALLPVATGAVAAGRLDAAVVQISLPPLVFAGTRVLTSDPRVLGWWRVWALGLAFAVTCAFAPLLWPVATVVLLVAAGTYVVLRRNRARALAAVLVAAVPLLVLFPWSLSALVAPGTFLADQQQADAALPAWHLLALSPGGPGMPEPWAVAGVVLAGLGGLVRLRNRRVAQVAWVVALLALVQAALMSRALVEGRPVWPGIAVQVAGLAVLVAALVAGQGVRSRLSETSFGWRQLVAALVAALAALGPVLAGVAWIGGVDGPVGRDGRQLLPAFAEAELAANPGLRALALAPDHGGRLHYALVDGRGHGLGESGLRPPASQRAQLDQIVADLASPRGSDAAEALATRAVRFVVLQHRPGQDALVAALDAQVGLVRRTSGAVDLWRVAAPAARLSLLPPELATQALAGARAARGALARAVHPTVLPAGAESARATIAPGPAGRLLVLADGRDSGWHATLDNVELRPRTAWGWAQAFEVPVSGGALRLTHSDGPRKVALGVQAALVLAVLVVSFPAGRRRRGLEDDLDDDARVTR
jgi:GT2 family glycosyltransferase